MRYHTVALSAVLGYVAKHRPAPARYQFRVVMEFHKSSPSRHVGPERGSYYVGLNLPSTNSNDWIIEFVEIDRQILKKKEYPDLKKFQFSTEGSAVVLVDHSKAKEYSIEIKSDNRLEMEVDYNTAYGYGKAKGTFSSDYNQVTIRDYGPTPYADFATLVAEIRFDEIKKF